MSEKRCAKGIYDGSYRGRNCRLKPTVERDGRWYCRLHDPVAVKQKRVARDAKWNAEWAAKEAAEKRTERIAKAKEAVVRAAKAWRVGPRAGNGELTNEGILIVAIYELEEAENL